MRPSQALWAAAFDHPVRRLSSSPTSSLWCRATVGHDSSARPRPRWLAGLVSNRGSCCCCSQAYAAGQLEHLTLHGQTLLNLSCLLLRVRRPQEARRLVNGELWLVECKNSGQAVWSLLDTCLLATNTSCFSLPAFERIAVLPLLIALSPWRSS